MNYLLCIGETALNWDILSPAKPNNDEKVQSAVWPTGGRYPDVSL